MELLCYNGRFYARDVKVVSPITAVAFLPWRLEKHNYCNRSTPAETKTGTLGMQIGYLLILLQIFFIFWLRLMFPAKSTIQRMNFR